MADVSSSATEGQETSDNAHGSITEPELEDLSLILPIAVPPERFARILAFDAGGAGCVSALSILRMIMCPSADSEPPELYPCRHFEMICGTEWGGILAIMLGRLRMVRIIVFAGPESSGSC